MTLGRPLLIKGEPGTGKTELARQVSDSLGLGIIEWNIKSTTKAKQGSLEKWKLAILCHFCNDQGTLLNHFGQWNHTQDLMWHQVHDLDTKSLYKRHQNQWFRHKCILKDRISTFKTERTRQDPPQNAVPT